MKKIFALTMIFIFSLMPLLGQAHLDGGEDITIDKYIVDFGFSPENPAVGDNVVLAFNLLDSETQEIIEPTHVWLRISKGDSIIFAGTMHPQARHVSFSYNFPEAGEYELTARFFDQEDQLVEHTFATSIQGDQEVPADLAQDNEDDNFRYIAIFLLILVVFLQLFRAFKKK